MSTLRKLRPVLRWVALLGIALVAGVWRECPRASAAGVAKVPWAVPSLPYRVLVEVPAVDLGARRSDSLVASLDLDFAPPRFAGLRYRTARWTRRMRGPVDLDSIQVLRHDPSTGRTLPAPAWPFARAEGERASRFLDKSLPWDFPWGGPAPTGTAVGTFPRGAYLMNVRGKGNPGLLAWDHTQEGRASSNYAVYFNTLAPGRRQPVPRQGLLGDGSPRREPDASSLTGTLYNRVAVDDWDGDGLPDLLIGTGFGHILLFRNEGSRKAPRFTAGKYLLDAAGQPVCVGSEACPYVVDWDGDGVLDLLCGLQGHEGDLVWYQNVGTNRNRKLVFRGYVQADGKPLIVSAAPCPETPHYKRDYAPSVQAVDWDGDGDLDLILGGYITGRLWHYENTGSAADGTPALTFRGAIEADGKPIDTIWGASACAVDLDSDGDLDLVSGSFGQAMGGGDQVSRFLHYYENVGTRRQPRFAEQEVAYDGQPPSDILAQARPLDFNGDGLTDLVISTFSSVYVAQNVGTRKAPRWKVTLLRAPWGIAPLSATQFMDLNGDGYPDIINSPLDGSGSPQVALNLGKGAHGVFGPSRPLLPPGQEISHPAPYGDPWAYVHLYDFDGDGVQDILWADGPGNAYLHRNRGSAQKPLYDTTGERLMPIKVGPPVVPVDKIADFTVMQGSRAGIAARDFDGDGRTDIAMGDTYGDVYYYHNVGRNQEPVFAQGVKLGNLGNRALPMAYDWDQDGRVDLLGVAWSGRMEWYRNLGQGAATQFAPPQPLNLPPTVPYSPRIAIVDWNGDGDDDIMVMSSYPWFCWLEGSYLKHGYIAGRILSVERQRSGEVAK